jgi:hypothetical protein
MEPNVSTYSCKGGVFLRIRALGVKCEKMGLKILSNAFYSKAAAMKHPSANLRKVSFGLQIK